MNDSREALEKRKEEVIAQLRESNHDVQMELDRDPEEQAIQVEQHDVSASFIENLRRELADIEDRLLSIKE
jgi:RNA polymerase-binding transcription factor DksA